MTDPQPTPPGDKHYVAKVLERKDLSEDLWLIRVDPGGPFSFKAGQYATLGVDHDGKRIERAYSIVSSPYEDGLEFFIELVPQGELTPHLYKLHVGDSMLCRKSLKGDLLSISRAAERITFCSPPSLALRPLSATSARFTRTGSPAIPRCPATTNFSAFKAAAVAGNSVIAKRWKKLRKKCPGLNTSRLSAVLGKTHNGQAKPAVWTTSCAITPRNGASNPPKPRDISVVIQIWLKTAEASSSAPAGKREVCLKKSTSSQLRKIELRLNHPAHVRANFRIGSSVWVLFFSLRLCRRKRETGGSSPPASFLGLKNPTALVYGSPCFPQHP